MEEISQFVDNRIYYGINSSLTDAHTFDDLRSDVERILHLVVRQYASMDDLLESFLQVGCEILSLDSGIVGHISNGQDYTLLASFNSTGELEKGKQLKLEQTICNEVYQSGEVIGITRAEDAALLLDAVYGNEGVEAYLSAPIFIDEDIYGTLAFFSPVPRGRGFSIHEKEMMVLMAKSLGKLMQSMFHEKALEEKNERLFRLVGYVAHDLRNPLGVIGSLSSLIHRKIDDEAQCIHLSSRIRTAADRCLEFVNSVLGAAALSVGKITLQPKAFYLNELLDEVLLESESYVKMKELQIDLQIGEGVRVYGDKGRLFQVFANLIGNAVKYSPDGSRLVVTAKDIGDDMQELTIQNEVENRLYSDLQNKKEDSIGFGLDIAAEIIELHGSTLRMVEESGRYTAQFTLPVVG